MSLLVGPRFGCVEQGIHIAVDEQKLTLYGLDIQLIGQRLAAENLNSAAGIVEEGSRMRGSYLINSCATPRGGQSVLAGSASAGL